MTAKRSPLSLVLAAMGAFAAAPALAEGHDNPQGNADAGEAVFARQCVSCHVIVDDAGELLAGRTARTGPNLYGLVGRQIAGREDFPQYGDALVELGAAGMVWTEENFTGYVMDPTGWIRDALDDRRARGRMAFQVRNLQDALDLYAYLARLQNAG